jgi:hypothetical protein
MYLICHYNGYSLSQRVNGYFFRYLDSDYDILCFIKDEGRKQNKQKHFKI